MQRVTRDQLCTSFSAAHAPVLRVQPGEPFVMETNDRFATYEGPTSSPEALEILKTMAGPVSIEGAKPGDTLKIEVLDVTLPLDYGWIGATPGRGPLGARIPAFRKARVQFTPTGVVFNERVTMPLRPMLGRIGLAPRRGASPATTGECLVEVWGTPRSAPARRCICPCSTRVAYSRLVIVTLPWATGR